MPISNGFLSMGQPTYQVSLEDVFGANRRKVASHLWKEHGTSPCAVFLTGGASATRYDSDHEPIFRQESYFWYLSGVNEPDCHIALFLSSNDSETKSTDQPKLETVLFVPKLPPDYATIMGRIKSLDEYKDLYKVDRVAYCDERFQVLHDFLNNHGTNPSTLYLLHGRNSDSGNDYMPPQDIIDYFQSSKTLTVNGNHSSPTNGHSHKANSKDEAVRVDTTTLFSILADCRVYKSSAEQALLQHVTEITSHAHVYVMRNLVQSETPSSGDSTIMYEYQAESLFRHYCYYNYGCRLVGYTPICACGPNAAVLHYGHAGAPNDYKIDRHKLNLLDMGSEYFGYGSDVTCTWPANGTFDEAQRGIYQAVLEAQKAVYQLVQPGTSWLDCHKAAEATILQHLIQIGIVKLANDKTVTDLVELRLGAVFMPHGLGHFVGIDTHDVGGYLPGNPPRPGSQPNEAPQPGLRSLRTCRVLQKDMVLTVEPGCYFIDHLLDEAVAESSPLRPYLDVDKLSEYRGFGGVRLEDVILVTEDGMVNWTVCPRTIEEVEGVLSGQIKWPPTKDLAPELRRVRLTSSSPLPSPPSK